MTSPSYREQHLEPLPRELLRRPLDYILADHLRQRVLCILCEQLADSQNLDTGIAKEVVTYLKTDMVVHVIDEEQDLFPLIRRRAQEEDDIEEALGQLSGEHATEEDLAAAITEGLESALGNPGEVLSDGLRQELKDFAQNERRHLALENATVMPLAKVRLTERDLKDLSARMAARRGILLETKD
ncbi:MAG: hemerythrin domain-containing protein [Hyphomicrobiaceae bacterium]